MASQGNYKQFHNDDLSGDSSGGDSGFRPDAKASKKENAIEIVEVDIRHTTGKTRRNIKAVLCSRGCLILFCVLIAFFAIFVISFSTGRQHSPEEDFPWKDIRLPKSAVPKEYNIFLHPNLDGGIVKGNETINIKAESSFNFIVLHVQKINITHISFRLESPVEAVKVVGNQTSESLEMLYVELAEYVPKGRYGTLELKFQYELSSTLLSGFYKSYYMEDGVKKTIASTQFEPTSARTAFPCFDEPSLKAKFSLAITHLPEYFVLSNMPKLKENVPYEVDNQYQVDFFEQSVFMSTYLVAFVVCEFGNLKSVTSSGTNVSVYAAQSQLDQAHLALEVLNETIPFYEDFYQVDYPLPKQDMIAIPEFNAGAMENWGLITYRESSLLYKPNATSLINKQWIVLTVTHELAHQWFGNLVTMEWWNDLWLNEGFATFVEYIGTNHFKPEWKMMEQFSYRVTSAALSLDGLANSHPILVEVNNPNEINAIFDTISYQKGAAIIHMLQDYITEDVFRKGINLYLKIHRYANSKTSDLWDALSKVANEGRAGSPINVTELMKYWTLQMGYPVVTFTRNGNNITVSQDRFLINPNSTSDEFQTEFGYRWMIPLTYFYGTSGSRQEVKREILHPDKNFSLLVQPHITWIKGNSLQSGFYRVNYDLGTWRELMNILNYSACNVNTTSEILSACDRASLLDDAFQLGRAGRVDIEVHIPLYRAGRVDIEVPLNMTRYLKNETEFVPWSSALDGLQYLGFVMRMTSAYDDYRTYLFDLLEPVRSKLGVNDEGEHLDKLLRVKVINMLVHLGHRETLQWAYENIKKWLNTGEMDVGVDLSYPVFSGGIKYGHPGDWDLVFEKFQNSTVATEKSNLISALAWTQDYDTLNRYLFWSLDPEKIRRQDMVTVIRSVAHNPAGFHLVSLFLVENWDALIERLGDGTFRLWYLISSLSDVVTSEFDYSKIKEFMLSKLDPAKVSKRNILQSLEIMETNIDFMKRNEHKVAEWFKREVHGS